MSYDDGAVSRRALLIGGGAAAIGAALGGGVAAEWDNPRFVRLRGGCGDTPRVPHSSYRVTTGTFDSHAMRARLPWAVAMPQRDGKVVRDVPVVLCLTGLGDGVDAVMSGIGFPGVATAAGVDVAFAAPGGGGNLYWHPRKDGRDPLAWAADEFLEMVEPRFVVGGAGRRGALGWSMGGYGALLAAQQRQGRFNAVAALSPAVYESYASARSGHSYTFDNETQWQRYGFWSEIDATLSFPHVRVDCGDADPFAPTARELLKRIPGAVGGISSGCHDKAFWRRKAPAALRFLAARLSV